MDKIKWWKGKCNKLTLLKDAYVTQANKMEEMQQKIDECERLSEEMTKDYEDTILSMCPRDECEPTYVWCQGKVVELVKQTDTQAVVKIKWNESCLQPGDLKVTRQVLKKSKWNPQKKTHGEQTVHGEKIYFI